MLRESPSELLIFSIEIFGLIKMMNTLVSLMFRNIARIYLAVVAEVKK